MTYLYLIIIESWRFLLEASPYMLLGIMIGGILKTFLSATYVARHLGSGRFISVFKAALLGIPLPLCSCGVLPAATSLKKQGANNGATTAFLISTPESGVDSISISYALLDPIMTIARPLAAFISAMMAGIIENCLNHPSPSFAPIINNCSGNNCCSDKQCASDTPHNQSFPDKLRTGLHYAFNELWGDLAGWFFIGIILAGLITVLVPDQTITAHLAGGFEAMLLMLLFGIPLYICATASTPIAAALILKGVNPGAALVFLLVGPATNIASLSMLIGLLGKRATSVYLISITVSALGCGLALDWIYQTLDVSPQAIVGQGGEILPYPVQLISALLLLALSIKPLLAAIKR
ncbi:MAG: SO_0444 family Cu/Zn efflux transporter [Desulfobulbaceae bacterium]|nr:SO_0444 family Cu/Zn efflux transporter [Desulfobulbaceae bacterium]HIJ78877.1 SO_0444 family Cu/Zn efflux transporter [Deltaproteobacteria bacterium]